MDIEAALTILARVHTRFTDDAAGFEVMMGAVPFDNRGYVEAWETVLDYLRRQGPDGGEQRERLQAENERLRGVLQHIVDTGPYEPECREICLKALQTKDDPDFSSRVRRSYGNRLYDETETEKDSEPNSEA